MPRIVDDVTLAQRFAELGMDGFMLKSHYTSTAERAAVVRAAVPGIQALGAIVLNRAVGGMNALAVEVAAREGARTVWLPTVDSVNESHERDAPAPARQGAGVGQAPARAARAGDRDRARAGGRRRRRGAAGDRAPCWSGSPTTGCCWPPGISPATRSSPSSTPPWRPASTQIVITHPEFPAQSLSVDDQTALAQRGALLERCMTTPHTGKIAWEEWIDNIRAAGPEHSVLSTDLGQVFNPPVEDGMGIMVDRLLAAGFSDEEVHVMAVANTRRVAGARPLVSDPADGCW